ncbi:hypothetical protein GCM10023084_72700 [Streptomyces lacrimifluminis]|uniref:Uncharacterized protein n=1 Tax=Streptomyces lacrimifluminis TaxID=1500077 RepID=A0A917P681_9ACTN|nr:hypothetical protein GCM10012282_70780 [Streptomyces lacrimifluminis]
MCPSGGDEYGREVARPGHDAVPGDRKVDRVQAGDAQCLVPGLSGPGRRGAGPRHEVVETGEQFVRRQVERRQRRDGGAHPAHGGGRAHAVSGDIPHHQPDACPGEGAGLPGHAL